MKLASYVAGGQECYGVVTDDGVITMRGHASLRDALAAGALEGMRNATAMAKPDFKLADIRFLPVIPNPHKILCAGVNYKSHAAEVGRELPKQPSMFIRFTDTLVGHQGVMIRPKLSDNFDFEGELTMVIGRGGRHIPIDKALDHVAGYTIFVDGSVRDYQKFPSPRARTGPAPARSGRGWSPLTKFPIPANSR
jgi:2-keto-4-pentenoate hydratase/2-oxohepta-3-ene-1,7-dioic acid hydratase in catechol pathway